MDNPFEEARLKWWLDTQGIPQYYEPFKAYGIDTIEDLLIMNEEDIKILQIKPFHLIKMRRDPAKYESPLFEPLFEPEKEPIIKEAKSKACYHCMQIKPKHYFNPKEWGKKDFGECSVCKEVKRTMLAYKRSEERKQLEMDIQKEACKNSVKVLEKTSTPLKKSPAKSPKKSPKKSKEKPPSSLCRLWKTEGHCSFQNSTRGCKFSHEPEWCGRAS